MIPSNIICVSQEGPANALALNKDATQVVIAGRNVFKVFAIGDNDFSEVCNLRVGKNLNLNFSSIDVAWSAIEENTLATAATNGAVVVWNLSRSGRSKQEHVFSDHKRTVNKVSFHLTEPSLLISGSQDGMMKCFDLRIKEVARTFISNTESIRDVQFSPHQAHTFAAVSENGSVQLWDVRRHERCIQQFTAHSGPVFACDWHPDVPWLATASRDKTIKVWDINTRALEHTIHTIASVGHVKWRPQKKWQVSSCALVLDCAVHVWDVRRPHLPLASFSPHRDVTTALGWTAPDALLACSRDCNLYRHWWSEAAHPALWGAGHAAGLGARGALALAAPRRPLPPLARHDPAPVTTHHTRKQPTAGSLTPAAQAALERLFAHCAAPSLRRVALGAGAGAGGRCGLRACALHYRLQGAPPAELCRHNADVARENNRHMVAHVWDVISLWLSSRAEDPAGAGGGGGGGGGGEGRELQPAAPPAASAPPAAAPPHAPRAPPEEPWSDSRFNNSGVLGMPTHTIYIPKQPTDDESGWVSAASAHYVDVDAAEWALPEEAFPLRAAPPAPAAPAPAPAPTADLREPPSSLLCEAPAAGGGCAGAGAGGASPGGSSAGSNDRSPTLHHQPSFTSSVYCVWGEGRSGSSAGAGAGSRGRVALGALLARALRHHADLGDVQTPATVLIALADSRNELCSYIEESLQEHWLLGYVELLQRHKLWNVATEVIGLSWVSSVWTLSQQSVNISCVCGRCGRRSPAPRAPPAPGGATPGGAARGGGACCQRAPTHLCAVCRRVVVGLFAWCQGCSHGGHLLHMQAWLQQHQLCPAGCGHRCQLG